MKRPASKAEPAEKRLGPVLRVFFTCLLIGVAAVGYVRQSHENTVLGDRIESVSNRKAQLEKVNQAMSVKLGRLKSSSNVASMVTQYGLDLDLVPWRPGQVIRLQMRREEPVDRGGAEGRASLVAQAGPAGRGSPN